MTHLACPLPPSQPWTSFFLRIPLFAFAFRLSYPVSSRLMSTPVLVREREQEGEIAIGSGNVRRSPNSINIRSNATYALVLLVLMEQRYNQILCQFIQQSQNTHCWTKFWGRNFFSAKSSLFFQECCHFTSWLQWRPEYIVEIRTISLRDILHVCRSRQVCILEPFQLEKFNLGKLYFSDCCGFPIIWFHHFSVWHYSPVMFVRIKWIF